MDIRLNIFDENNRWVNNGKPERGSWRGRAVGDNDINWRYESAIDETLSVPQANDIIPTVNNAVCPKCGCNKLQNDGTWINCLNVQCDWQTDCITYLYVHCID